jgi:hypothetical protein
MLFEFINFLLAFGMILFYMLRCFRFGLFLGFDITNLVDMII